jgi:phage terminase small subunit
MSKRGPKGSHLELVDATSAVDDPPATTCGGRTKSGGECRKPPGQGTDHPGAGQCRHHDGQVEPGSPCPLPLTALELRLWEEITGQLRALRLLKGAFWPHIFGLVVALAALHNARQELDVIAVAGRGASVKKNPAATVVNQMLAQIRQFSNDLGLNPSALASIGPPDDDGPPSKMARFIRGRGPR